MKKLSILNWTLIVLCLASGTLFLISNLKPYSIVELIEPELSNGLFVGQNFSTAKDSVAIRSLKGYWLKDNPQNDAVEALVKQMSHPDSLKTPTMARIISVNGIPWSQILDAKQRKQHIKNRSYFDPLKDTCLLKLEYRGNAYNVLLPRIKTKLLDVSIKVSDSLFTLIFFLIPAISSGFRYRKLFIGLVLITVLDVLLTAYGLFTLQPLAFELFKDTIGYIFSALLIIPLFGLLGRKYRFLPWVFLAVMALNIILQSEVVGIITLALAFLLGIIQERGINRKFYLEFVYLLLIIAVVLLSVLGIFFLSIPKSGYELGKTMRAFMDLPALSYMINALQAVPVLLVQLAMLPFIMLFYRVIRMRIKILEKIFLFFATALITIVIANYLMFLIMYYHKRVEWTWVLLGVGFIVAYGITRYVFNLFPLIKPVRFSQRDKTIKLLNKSYSYTDRKAYAEMFIGYIKGLNHSYHLAFYGGDFRVGDEFMMLEEPRLNEVIAMLPANSNILNIDIELLNDTDLGRKLEDFDNKLMPHLLLLVNDDEGKAVACFALGKMPGIYWHESLAKALLALVEVFRGFYLNMLAQENLREQSKSLVQEQEAREFNEKLAIITQEKNALLVEEKKRIMESIEYASLIQKSILPQSSDLNRAFPQNFIIWRPRDIVGGDFYWLFQIPETGELLFAVIDCTGHGVPGALMSVAANAAMDRVVRDSQQYEPAKILSILHQSIGTTLHQESEKTQQDGMDMSLIRFNPLTRKLVFSGAKHNLLIHKADTKNLIKIMGNRMSVGGLKWKQAIEFEQQELELTSGDTIYLFTDGIIDQPANTDSPKRQRLGSLNWQAYLQSISAQPLFTQREIINAFIDSMLITEEQRDDICIAAIKI